MLHVYTVVPERKQPAMGTHTIMHGHSFGTAQDLVGSYRYILYAYI